MLESKTKLFFPSRIKPSSLWSIERNSLVSVTRSLLLNHYLGVGTSGVHVYTLRDKGDEKRNIQEIGTELETKDEREISSNSYKITEKLKLSKKSIEKSLRPDQGDKNRDKKNSWMWFGLKVDRQSLAASFQQLIILSLTISCRRM